MPRALTAPLPGRWFGRTSSSATIPEVGHEEKHGIAGAAVLTVAASVFMVARPASAAVGLHVSGRNIVEANVSCAAS